MYRSSLLPFSLIESSWNLMFGGRAFLSPALQYYALKTARTYAKIQICIAKYIYRLIIHFGIMHLRSGTNAGMRTKRVLNLPMRKASSADIPPYQRVRPGVGFCCSGSGHRLRTLVGPEL